MISVLFVGSPFYLRAAIAAFQELDEDVMAAARTLGASPARVFARIAVPVSLPALSAGAALAFARGRGGVRGHDHVRRQPSGSTQTLPLAIYGQFESNLDIALAIGASARGVQRGDPARRQAAGGMGILSVELGIPLRTSVSS